MEIEFTDRYGGHTPSWLRGCHGECEAMGFYPVQGHAPEKKSSVYSLIELTAEEKAAVQQMIDDGKYSADGWYFIKCPDCDGTGRCSWKDTTKRIVPWFVKGVKFMYQNRPGSMIWSGHPFSWKQRVWVNLKSAFLLDIQRIGV